MTDRYQVIREALPALIAEAQAKGGRNERAALIVELLEERDALNAENERLRNLLRRVHPIVQAHAGASHLLEGFRPKRNQWDELVDAIDAAMREGDEQ